MDLIRDVSRGDWLLARLGEFGSVGWAAGSGFPAYVRILHPVQASREDRTVIDRWGTHPTVEDARWRWSDVAARTGSAVHPLVKWSVLSGPDNGESVTFDDGWRASPPELGQLEPGQLSALTEHLRAATGTPDDLVAGIWEGWGDLNGSSAIGVAWIQEEDGEEPTLDELAAQHEQVRRLREKHRSRREAVLTSIAGPRLQWPGREHFLLRTTLSELAGTAWFDDLRTGEDGHTPQVLWPEDHAWVVGSEIDCDSTIVAGSRALVDAIVDDERFEALEVDEESVLP